MTIDQRVMASQQRAWATGDYHRIGLTMTITSELLCESVALRAGERVLDVAAGTGNTALSAARRWCDTVASDFVPDLLELARDRAAAEGLSVRTDVADAQQLPYPDGSFDVVLSTFGAMFAPDQQRTADELLRVCRPGGRIGLTNWTPDGLIGQQFALVGSYAPPPPGVPPPSRWGDPEYVRTLFGDRVTRLTVIPRQWTMRFRSLDHAEEVFTVWFGPIATALARIGPERAPALVADLRALWSRWNTVDDGTVYALSSYIEVVAEVA
jgi:ubiquinone/menaquinone biosynthesis C-methylase UbiE